MCLLSLKKTGHRCLEIFSPRCKQSYKLQPHPLCLQVRKEPLHLRLYLKHLLCLLCYLMLHKDDFMSQFKRIPSNKSYKKQWISWNKQSIENVNYFNYSSKELSFEELSFEEKAEIAYTA